MAQQKNSYYQLVSIFTPLASPDSETASSSLPPAATAAANSFQPPLAPPEQQHDLTPAEIDRICKLEIDRLFDTADQTPPVPYPDTPLFRRLAKLDLQQQQDQKRALVVKDDTPIDEQQCNTHGCAAAPQEVERESYPSSAAANVESAACLSTAQVVLSQIKEVLTDEDKDSDVSEEELLPESFSDCVDDDEQVDE